MAVSPARAAVAAPGAESDATDTGTLGARPPMGWNSWNTFGCNINEKLIREAADSLVSSGMAKAGYQYVNIDDCWAEKDRDPVTGQYVPSRTRFPSGIKALADYVHAKGLKLGIYTSAGTLTCAKTMPGSLGHEDLDARTFASWDVDLLKYDNCNNQGVPAKDRYQAMGDALRKSGRDILYSICEWGANDPWLWGKSVGGQMWRTTGDINASWGSVMSILDQQAALSPYSGPGGWNDPDMLEVGNPGLTVAESRAHMSLWSLLNAPLIAGNDVRSMPAWVRTMLTDPDVLAVDQDWGGRQGMRIRDDGDQEVWSKPMSDGSVAVVLLNRGAAAQTISTSAAELKLPEAKAYTVRDLWANTEAASNGAIRAQVGSHDAVMLRITPGTTTALPPLVTVVVQPSAPYVEDNAPVKVQVKVYNDGTSSIDGVRVDLTAPETWTAKPAGSTRIASIRAGQIGSATWSVSADRPDAGPVDLGASASWLWRRNAYSDGGAGRFVVATRPPAGESNLSDLTLLSSQNGWGPVERDQSNGEAGAGDGNPLTIAGVQYAKGFGTHAPSSIDFFLGSHCSRLTVTAGIDDEVGDQGRAGFEIRGDDAVLASTEATGAGPAVPLTVDLTGVQHLELRTTNVDGPNFDHTDWAQPKITCA
ncbi:alpha-galactosidase [Kribbella aluminosa]|uniref:Alpha-galactosidase n=1 Tax=Kribbella aluminosa TaxID=416017 RepID=A0ABS4UWK7_9ACTN|nr:NPCBM/NEW2 domain-containing protein [Kribbella aluminosa]MBP2356043.1 alpha-galactosidase [Kribbella aluminosa]